MNHPTARGDWGDLPRFFRISNTAAVVQVEVEVQPADPQLSAARITSANSARHLQRVGQIRSGTFDLPSKCLL